MANVQKYTMSAVGSMLRHYSRAPDDGVERSNKTIDPDRTHLNYNLAADLHPEQSQKEYLENRLSEVKHLDYRKRTNINVLCDWVVTLPDNVPPEREKEFFKNVYDFLCERYGKENVISACIQEGVRAEMLKHDAEIKAKQAERDKLSLEIEEQERQLDIINTEFYGNEAFMRKAQQNQQDLMDTIQKWSKEYEN